MNKLLIFSLLLVFTSCANDDIIISREEYQRLKGADPSIPTVLRIGNYSTSLSDYTNFVIDFGSDGHQYAHNYNANLHSYVAFHYIECSKCKKDTL